MAGLENDALQAPLMLQGRVALVTGASSGLGRRFAMVLARCGARVLAAGRRLDRLQALAAGLQEEGAQVVPVVLDVSAPADVLAAAVAALDTAHGGIDILINNAGVGHTAPATELGAQQLDALLATNIRGPYVLACEVARRLIDRQRPGRIINLSSVGAYHYSAGMQAAAYCASKAAIVRLTEALAMEWARHGINVNAIAPGLFDSEMTQAQLQQQGERMLARLPRQRAGQPEQLDSTLRYLVDPASEFVTGICLRIDDAQYPR